MAQLIKEAQKVDAQRAPLCTLDFITITIIIFLKLHFHIYKLNIQIQISLMLGNLHSAGLSTDISTQKANKRKKVIIKEETLLV